MARHSAVQFDRRLHKLFDDRTVWLRRAVRQRNPGRPPSFDRKKVSRTISALQELASQAVVKKAAQREFSQIVDKKKQWRVSNSKGWGWRAKRESFDSWFQLKIPYPNCIYVFWAGRKSRYVGRTVRGKGRPQSHFGKSWFPGITRIDIYSTSSPSQVPKLECLAIHRFQPRENGVKASFPKWAKKCPVCKVHKLIRQEIRTIFRLRT